MQDFSRKLDWNSLNNGIFAMKIISKHISLKEIQLLHEINRRQTNLEPVSVMPYFTVFLPDSSQLMSAISR